MLEATEKGLKLTDLGSANGTFVNGVRIQGSVILNIDDRVIFDRIPFRIRRSLNLPELHFDELHEEQPAGFARRRLIEARRQRLASEGKLSSLDLSPSYDESPHRYKLRSRYAAYKPVMLGSALALLVASIIIYLL